MISKISMDKKSELQAWELRKAVLPRTVSLPNEVVAELVLNGTPVASTHCSPGHIEELAFGFLVSEGIVKAPSDILSIEVDGTRLLVQISGVNPESFRASIVSGCGRAVSLGDYEQLFDCATKINLDFQIDASELRELVRQFTRLSLTERKSRGIHLASLYRNGEFTFFCQDIGRHNAMDRVIGRALLQKEDLTTAVLLVSGRLSLEMVAKAIRCGIPVLFAISVPTASAVELASNFHICVVSGGKANKPVIYSALHRITGAESLNEVDS